MVVNFLEHVVIIPAPFLAQNLKDRNTTKPYAIEVQSRLEYNPPSQLKPLRLL